MMADVLLYHIDKMMGSGISGRSNRTNQFEWENFQKREAGETIDVCFLRGLEAYIEANCISSPEVTKENLHLYPDHWLKVKERLMKVLRDDVANPARGLETVKRYSAYLTLKEDERNRSTGVSKEPTKFTDDGNMLALH